MKHVKYIAVSVFLVLQSSFCTAETLDIKKYTEPIEKLYTKHKVELEKAKDETIKKIKFILDHLDILEKEEQETTKELFATQETEIAKSYAAILEEIKKINEKHQKDAKTIITQAGDNINQAAQSLVKLLTQNQQTLLKKINEFNTNTRAALQDIEKQFIRIQSAVRIKKGKKKLKQVLEIQKKQNALWQQLIPLLPKLEHIDNDMYHMLRTYIQNGILDTKKLQEISHNYQNLLETIYQKYTAFDLPIQFDDPSNYVSILMQRLINLYLHDASITLEIASRDYIRVLKGKFDRRKYYQLFVDLAQRFSAHEKNKNSRAYTKIIQTTAQKYFGKKSAVIVDSFTQKYLQMCLNPYGSVLSDMSIKLQKPNEQDLVNAQILFTEMTQLSSLLKGAQAQQAFRGANSLIAALYVQYAQMQLKQMEVLKNNETLHNNAINAFQKASIYYTHANNSIDANQNKTLAQYLMAGKQLTDRAESAAKRNALQEFIQAYQQAYMYYVQAGNEIEAYQVNKKNQQMSLEQVIKQAQNTGSNFVDEMQTTFKEYVTFLNSSQTEPTTSFSFSKFIEPLNQMLSLYQKALLIAQQIDEKTTILRQTIQLAENMKEAYNLAQEADLASYQETFKNLLKAENLYHTAFVYAQEADTIFNEFLAENMPLYQSLIAQESSETAPFTMVILLARHRAHRYFSMANTSKDPMLAAVFCHAALHNKSFISKDFFDVIKQKFLTFSDHKDQLLKHAQELATQANKMNTQDDWTIKPKGGLYENPASFVWQQALESCATSLQLGNQSAKEEYGRIAREFAQAYAQHISEESYKNLGATLIHYNAYLITDKKDTTAKSIIKPFQTFLTLSKTLQEQITTEKESTKITQAMDALNQWLYMLRYAYAQQQSIMSLSKKASDLFDLTTKEDSIECIITFPGITAQPITITQPTLLSAQAYKTIADNANANKKYTDAYQAYYKAQEFFEASNKKVQAQKVKEKGDVAYSQALADSYATLVIPNQKEQHNIPFVALAKIPIPERFELLNFVQEIPADLIKRLNIAQAAQESAEKQRELLYEACLLLFLSHALKEKKIDFNAVVEGKTIRTSPTVTDDLQKQEIQNIVSYVQKLVTDIKERVKKKESKIDLQTRKLPDGTLSYSLMITYQPIFPTLTLEQVPTTQIPYKQFPTAFVHYNWAARIADPEKKHVLYGPKLLVSIRDKSMYDRMTLNMIKAYLNAGLSIRYRIDYIIKGSLKIKYDPLLSAQELKRLDEYRNIIRELKKIDKSDEKVNLKKYLEVYRIIEQYINDGMITYYQFASSLTENPETLEKFNILFSQTYELLGSIGELFLVGNPQNPDYFAGEYGQSSGILSDIARYYKLAYSLDSSVAHRLQTKVATLFMQAGTLIAKRKNYIGSVPFYKNAVGIIQATPKADLSLLNQASINLLKASFYGALERLMYYRKAHIHPLKIKLSSGTTETITLNQLVEKIPACPNPNIDPAECRAYEKIRLALLDALVYFQDCVNWAKALQQSQGAQKLSKAQQQQISQKAKTYVDTFMKNKNISLDSPKNSITTLNSNEFEDNIKSIFDQCTALLINATSTQDRFIGFAAVHEWANALFISYSKIYMQNYLKHIQSKEQFLQFFKALSTQRESARSAAEAWLG